MIDEIKNNKTRKSGLCAVSNRKLAKKYFAFKKVCTEVVDRSNVIDKSFGHWDPQNLRKKGESSGCVAPIVKICNDKVDQAKSFLKRVKNVDPTPQKYRAKDSQILYATITLDASHGQPEQKVCKYFVPDGKELTRFTSTDAKNRTIEIVREKHSWQVKIPGSSISMPQPFIYYTIYDDEAYKSKTRPTGYITYQKKS